MVKEKEEVELFLRQFFPKLKVMGIVFLHRENSRTICISFHVAEHPLHYAFK